MKNHLRTIVLIAIFVFTSFGCKKNDSDNSINIFSVDEDIALGAQMDVEIMNNPTEYPILSESQYSLAYQHLNAIRDNLLLSDNLNYKARFTWKVRIIQNDNVLNAFCTPGGYIYFYTGIIKFLDNEAQFVGVMAHEMAHADRRHVTDNLTKTYGFSILIGAALGNKASELEKMVAGIAQGLSNLAFSRDNEYQADEYAVKYTDDTHYDARGIAGFFEKMEAEKLAGNTPSFLNTHPSPEDRLEKINEVWVSLGSNVGQLDSIAYAQFKSSLP